MNNSIYKVSTSGTTVYYVDVQNKRFLRVKGETSASNLWFDGDWNDYANDPEITVGKGLYFVLMRPMGAWQASTAITAIELVNPEDLPNSADEVDSEEE